MKYFNKLLHDCEEASILSLKNKEEGITLKQQFEVKFHMLFCKCCKNFTKQSVIIDESIKAFFKGMESNPPMKASDSFKARIEKLLK